MKTLIAIPCMDTVATPFMTSLMGLRRVGNTRCGVTVSSLTYDARNTLAAQALDSGCDRVLWLDSDMTFQPDLMVRLSEDLDRDLDYVAGVCVKRRPPITPVIYGDLQYERTDSGIHSRAVPVTRIEPGLFPVAATGFGAVMMSCTLLKRVFDRFGPPFTPMMGLGEDLSFCWRVRELGEKMWCDGSVRLGHVGPREFTINDWKGGGAE